MSESVTNVLGAVWATIGLLGGLFFRSHRDAPLRRRLYPPFVVLISLLFAGLIVFVNRSAGAVAVALPAAALIAVINIRGTKFCDACGSMIVGGNPASPPKYCEKCGAALQ